ncbi:ABC transporter permease [Lachnospiraceae bacterium ZAX-1]
MKQKLIKLIQWTPFPALALLVFFLILNQFLSPGYLRGNFVSSFLAANASVIIVSIGTSIVLIGGGMDISMGGLLCLVNVVYVLLSEVKVPLPICLLMCIVVGFLGGMFNGLCIAVFRVTPLLTTFATSFIFGGIALWLMKAPRGSIQRDIVKWYFSWLKGYGAPVLFIGIAIIAWLVIKQTKMGVWIYAVGQDEVKAYASGVPVQSVKLFMYGFSGMVTGMGGMVLTTYIGAGDPLIAISYTMTIIAACVIGGILLSGGIGDAIGALFGAMFLGSVITTVLSSVRDSFFHNFVQGIIMVIGVIGSILLSQAIQRAKNKALGGR